VTGGLEPDVCPSDVPSPPEHPSAADAKTAGWRLADFGIDVAALAASVCPAGPFPSPLGTRRLEEGHAALVGE